MNELHILNIDNEEKIVEEYNTDEELEELIQKYKNHFGILTLLLIVPA